MDHTGARAFAEQWGRHWNAHDVDALLEHGTCLAQTPAGLEE
jgi:hypothetical protein